VSLQQHEREYLLAKVTALDVAIENLQRLARSPREQAAVDMLTETRTKLVEALARPPSGLSDVSQQGHTQDATAGRGAQSGDHGRTAPGAGAVFEPK
jgi:hypothetical protein